MGDRRPGLADKCHDDRHECWTVLIKYCQYNNRAMNESHRFAGHKPTSLHMQRRGFSKGSAHQFETQGAGDVQHATTRRNATQRKHITQYRTHHDSLSSVGEQATPGCSDSGGMETTIKSKPQMLEALRKAAQEAWGVSLLDGPNVTVNVCVSARLCIRLLSAVCSPFWPLHSL